MSLALETEKKRATKEKQIKKSWLTNLFFKKRHSLDNQTIFFCPIVAILGLSNGLDLQGHVYVPSCQNLDNEFKIFNLKKNNEIPSFFLTYTMTGFEMIQLQKYRAENTVNS